MYIDRKTRFWYIKTVSKSEKSCILDMSDFAVLLHIVWLNKVHHPTLFTENISSWRAAQDWEDWEDWQDTGQGVRNFFLSVQETVRFK